MTTLINGVWHQTSATLTGSRSSIFLIGEQTNVMLLAIDHHLSEPLTHVLSPADTTVGRRCPCVCPDVLHVRTPLTGHDSQVGASAVEGVAVDVISLSPIGYAGQIEHFAMEPDRAFSSIDDLCASDVPITDGPTPLSDPISINGVNQCVRSDGTITGADLDPCCRVRKNSDLGRPASVSTPARRAAIDIIAALDFAWPYEEVTFTVTTNAGYGTLTRHHDLLTRTRGVRPRIVASGPGPHCVNYTAFFLMESA